MIGRVLAFGALLVWVTALPALDAQAQDDDEEYEEELYFEKESSAYAELNAGASYFLVDGDDAKDRASVTAGVVVGGHINPYVSMEVQYDWHEYSDTHLASYNLRFTVLTGRIQPWVKAGIGLMGGRPGHPFLFMGRTGLGVNVFLTEQLAIAPSVSHAVAAHDNNILTANLGLVYYFE